MFKNIGKTFLILPIAIYPFLSQLFSEPNDTGVTELLIGSILGSITEGDITKVVFVVGKMGYLLVFHLLFGTYISKHFSYMPGYYFSRIHNRCTWFLKQCLSLFLYAGWYVFLFLGSTLLGCSLTSAGKTDGETWRCFWILFGICYTFLILTTLLINFGIIIWKAAIGFSVCWIGIVILTIISNVTIRRPLISFLNPISYYSLLEATGMYLFGKFMYMTALVVCAVIFVTVFLRKYDITLREVD